MSWLDPIPAEDLGTRFTHYGWFVGLVPVYIGDPHQDAPIMAERNWVPGWWLGAVTWLFHAVCSVAEQLDPEFEPLYPIQITGRIAPRRAP
ncbi:MAG: hypothetical protein QM788_05420 [Roseateles sp.]|uniref:hypothetical protein n=1 Tax=Roseateles sp. TaxID=1971397 RepID=UPI0039ECFC2D